MKFETLFDIMIFIRTLENKYKVNLDLTIKLINYLLNNNIRDIIKSVKEGKEEGLV